MKQSTFLDKLRLEEGWFSLAALGLAFMSVVWSLQDAAWTKGLSILPQVGLIALLLGFGLAKVRFIPALLAHSFIASVGMVYIGVLAFPYLENRYDEADWTQKLGGVVLRVVRWSDAALNGRSSYDALVFLVSLAMLIWISGYGVAWLVFRRQRVWMAVFWIGAILVVNLSYNPPQPLKSFAIYLLCSLLLVVRYNAFLNEMRWRRLRMPHRQQLWRGAMMVGTSLVIFIMLLALAIPSSSQIEPLGQALSGVSGPWDKIQSSLPGIGVAPNTGPARETRLQSGYSSLAKSFTIGGPITLSDQPVLRVKGDDPRYLQAAAMDLYDGKGWQATYQDATPGNKTDKVFSQLSLAPGQSLPTAPDKGRAPFGLTVTPLVPGFDPVITTGDLVSANRSALLSYHWERTIIKTPLNRINPRTIPDGNGGYRTVTYDDASNQLIPPDLLPLVKLFKDAQAKGGLIGLALATRQNYNLNVASGYAPPRSVGNSSVFVRDAYTWEIGDWLYKLPTLDELKALNIPANGVDRTSRLQMRFVSKQQPDKSVIVPIANVRLNSDGTVYNFTLDDSQLNGQEAMRSRFEQSDAGQKIKAEVERLGKEVPGNRINYSLQADVPFSLDFDGYVPNYDDLLASNFMQAPLLGESYTSTGRRYRADEQSLMAAPVDYPAWVRNRYLQLPETVPQRVKDLAQSLTAGKATVFDKAKAIEAYLRTIPYSLTEAKATPPGRDPVDYFLFDSRIGYCEHYSTAFNVMMRSLGVPTREVVGFIGGEFDPTTGTSVVRANAAHAWSQIYFPGYGWVDFEPTAAYSAISRPPNPASVAPLPTPTPEAAPAPAQGENTPDPQPTTGTDANATPEAAEGASAANAALNSKEDYTLVLWLFGIIGAIGLCFGLYQANQWWLKRQLRLTDVAPMAVYQRMVKSAKRAGLKTGQTATPYEFAAYLGRKLPSVRGEIRSFTDGFVRQRYGPQLADEELKRELAELEAARARVALLEEQGGQPSYRELEELRRSQTVLLQSPEQIREMWISYQLGIIAYTRRRRTNRYTPRFFRKLYARLKGLRHRVSNK